MHDGELQVFRRIWFVGFAGHRKVGDAAALKAIIRHELDGFCARLNGEVVGLASAAAGADLIFLEACEEAGLRTVVILPFAEERFAEDFENAAEWMWCRTGTKNRPRFS